MRTNSSWKRSNGFSDTLGNNSKIPYGSHWLQCFLELVYLQKTAMLVTSAKREVEPSMAAQPSVRVEESLRIKIGKTVLKTT